MAKRGAGCRDAARPVLLSAKSELWQSVEERMRRQSPCCYQRKVNYGKAVRFEYEGMTGVAISEK